MKLDKWPEADLTEAARRSKHPAEAFFQTFLSKTFPINMTSICGSKRKEQQTVPSDDPYMEMGH